MDDLFAQLMDIADGGDSYSKEMQVLENQLKEIEVHQAQEIIPQPVYIPPVAIVPGFDPQYNLLDEGPRNAFKNIPIFDQSLVLFTEPVLTTSTVQGSMTNTVFLEEDLIGLLSVDTEILAVKSNFGKLFYDKYVKEEPPKKTNRGRKKKEKPKKVRNMRGTGDEMASQITFVIRSSLVPVSDDGVVPGNAKVYKFKVFRTGNVQLPGVKPADIDDVITCAKIIANELNIVLHAGHEPANHTTLVNLNPVMNNYKFAVKLGEGIVFLLPKLQALMTLYETNPAFRSTLPPHPTFNFGKCKFDKISVLFDTPIPDNPKKKARLNIFMQGKVNILGGLHQNVTEEICRYFHFIIQKHLPEITGIER